MRTIVIALVLGLFAVGTASAAPHHGKKHHARSMKHAKIKSHHSGAKRA
jgi:hypothetical protein